jgi:hypothetical protein
MSAIIYDFVAERRKRITIREQQRNSYYVSRLLGRTDCGEIVSRLESLKDWDKEI